MMMQQMMAMQGMGGGMDMGMGGGMY